MSWYIDLINRGCHLGIWICLLITHLVEDIEILLHIKFRWILFSGCRGKVENVSAYQWLGQPSWFFHHSNYTILVDDVEILLPAKFRWVLFSGFRGEVKKVSANQRQGRPSCFSDQSENHKLGRGRWDLASCQVSSNSVQRFQRRSRKCESSLRMDRRKRRTITIAHLSLWLRWAKN